jgi:hypothetical protein
MALALAVCLAGCGGGGKTSTSGVATASATPAPTAMATATLTPGALRVSDPAAARQLSFAFAQHNDVWVSLHGQAPQQVTHLGLGTQSLSWGFVWTSDQSKVLAVAQSGQSGYAWTITLASDTVTPMPATLPTVDSAPRAWIGDRYLVYVSQESSHARAYDVYDTQAQRALATPIATTLATKMEVRGESVYITDYRASDGPGPTPTPGVVRRYDLASNTVTTAFTVPAMLVAQGLPVGSWDLSADASRIISASPCTAPPCSVYLQDTSGTTTVVHSLQPDAVLGSLSPDGTSAAGSLGGTSGQAPAIVQQALPSGPGWTNAVPDTSQNGAPTLLGWLASPAGILVEDYLEDAGQNTIGVRIYEAPLGTSQPAHLVETVQAAAVFSPVGA